MNLSISPGKNNVGAYINDINLKSLDQEQATEIKKILNQFGVIFIKEQNLDPQNQIFDPNLKCLPKSGPLESTNATQI